MAGACAAIHRHSHCGVYFLLAQLGQNRIPGDRHHRLAVHRARGRAGGGAAGQAWLETIVRLAVLAADAGRDSRRTLHVVRQLVRAAGDRIGERSARPV